MAGAGRYIKGLISGLVQVNPNHEILILCNRDNSHVFNPLPHGFSKIGCSILTEARLTRIVWEQTYLPRLTKRLGIDLLHSTSFVAPFLLPCRSVVSVYDTLDFSRLSRLHPKVHRYYRSVLTPRSVKKADSIIAISESTRRDIVETFGIPEEKVAVTYLGVDHEVFRPVEDVRLKGGIKAKYGIHGDFILYVGKIQPQKNLTTLIRAFRELTMNAALSGYKLVISGNKGWAFDEVFATVKALRLENEITFTGYVSEEDLPLLYSAAKLFVYPSLYEGFGIPLLEAMACGTPVITSNISSLPEVVGDAGILVNPTDRDELAFAMQSVLKSGSLQREMKLKGLARARLFTWGETARRTLQVYEGTS